MDPKPVDLGSAGGGDADEFAITRKRSCRVSFAKTTAVHVFDRDEDFETPPELKYEGWNVGSGELGLGGDQCHFCLVSFQYLALRAKLDKHDRLLEFVRKLESSCVETVESGKMSILLLWSF
ncbi:uncharacterized protein A4U43_C01F24400 [Asparagus officinalis]|uniref:Uncharacterized protein n=1 Tax=Asparagus officinalis TaxID=4686 RepID=A0A5P1FTL8_ASPOF|nr:uncharacterized protein A4U43_C01F24400 [Asparagus officinalis]